MKECPSQKTADGSFPFIPFLFSVLETSSRRKKANSSNTEFSGCSLFSLFDQARKEGNFCFFLDITASVVYLRKEPQRSDTVHVGRNSRSPHLLLHGRFDRFSHQRERERERQTDRQTDSEMSFFHGIPFICTPSKLKPEILPQMPKVLPCRHPCTTQY